MKGFIRVFAGFILLAILFSSATFVFSQSKISTSSADEKDIESFKEKLASKVAEMRKKDQKAIAGNIVSVGKDTFKIKTSEKVEYEVKVDDILTKYYKINGAVKKEISFDDLEKDIYVIVTGPTIDKTVSANFVYQDEPYIVGFGKILEVNKTSFFVKVLTFDKENYTLDIETSTKQSMVNIKTVEIERTGFQKIKEGDMIHFVGLKPENEKEANRFSASKILVIPQEYFIK